MHHKARLFAQVGQQLADGGLVLAIAVFFGNVLQLAQWVYEVVSGVQIIDGAVPGGRCQPGVGGPQRGQFGVVQRDCLMRAGAGACMSVVSSTSSVMRMSSSGIGSCS